MAEYLAWIGTLAAEDRAIVHTAASYFAAVYARDLDAVFAAIEAVERRIAALEASALRAREAGADG